ncbi:DUF1217 domain-containing protein [Methylorubrum suomiense]|uniref:DUF1217 domain-containing protein n=1 Tax=Methylorubrum suomiense TaxID=144191 RepID=A0ABQ4USL3_9HYPH|nr:MULTISPECIES: DUF1217 domain-containing protein [Methylobacteriaceae]GJE74378.1 hypothetical protein BGCPKDLD_0947 [Methylorubrum suomiense]
MTDTLTRYRLIVQDLPNSLKRKAAEPTVSRDTAYYEANIGKVRTVDDLMADRRLYTYAMKAYGLEDMTYAKAFMRKVMTEGAGSRTSFANRLSDDRYVAIARAFNFATALSAAGTDPESFGKAAVPARLSARTELAETTDFSGSREARFVIESRIDATTVKSVTITLNAKTLTGTASDLKKVTRDEIAQAINAQISATGDTGLKDKVQVGIGVNKTLFFETKAFQSLGADEVPGGTGRNADITVYAGGKNRTIAIRNVALTEADRTAVNVGFGTDLGPEASAKIVTAAYLRQTLENDAGSEDTGVRLALYFARMAPTLSSAYQILGDRALSKVANTVVGLPPASGAPTKGALAARAKLITAKIDFASFSDPKKVDAFVQRFAAIWDAQNDTQTAPVLALFSSRGIDAELLGQMQTTRRGR